MRKYKHIKQQIEIKKYKNFVTFYGYASVFNVEDSYGDIILKGAFENISNNKVKLLWQHDMNQPIGLCTSLQEDNKGLFIEGKICLKTRQGQEAYELIKEGVISGLSIGFNVEDSFYENGKRHITDVDLMEVSVVTLPANSFAEISLLEECEEAQLANKLDNMNDTLEEIMVGDSGFEPPTSTMST